MNDKQVKAEFGLIILKSYSAYSLKIQDQLTEVLETSYERYREWASQVLMESYSLHLSDAEYADYMHLASSFIYWWSGLETSTNH